MSCTYEKEVVQGTNRQYRLTFTSPEAISDSNPDGLVDLTGSTIYYRWKRNQTDPNPAEISKSSDVVTEIEILTQSGDTLGQADVFLVPADTDSLPAGTHYWDAWIQLTDGTRHAAIPPTKVFLIDAVTDLTSPSPSPSGGPGDGDDVSFIERSFTLTHQQTQTLTVSLGRVPVDFSLVAVTAEVGDAVSAGTIQVNVKLNGTPVLTADLDSVTNPVYDKDQATTGTNSADETDDIDLEVVITGYENAGATGSELEIVVALAREAILGAVVNNFTATSAPTANDDSDDGYAVGSRWIDISADQGYECVDATVAAAVWNSTGMGAHDFGGSSHNADTFANFSTKISDATLAALGLQQAFSKQQRATPYALTTGGANIALPVTESNAYTATITQATQQLDNPTGTLAVGMQWMVIVKQDATGGRALTFGTEYDWGAEDAPDLTVLTGDQYAIINCTVVSVSPDIIFAVYVGGAG